MLIKSLFIQNFLSYKEAKINFTEYDGITMIEGRSDSTSRDSNGSGKSALLDAITYALFGKIVRKQKTAESVVNRFTDKRMLLILVVNVDGTDITIERSRHKGVPLLRVSGLDNTLATTKGTQEALESLIGMDYRLFTSSVMFGGVASSFCSMTDAERKKILEEMLEFDYFLAAQKLANDRLGILESEVQNAQTKIESTRDLAIDAERTAKEADEKEEGFEKSKEAELRKMKKEHSDLCEKWDSVQNELIAAKKEWTEKSEDNKNLRSAWKKRRADADALVGDAQEKKEKCGEKLAEASANLRNAQKQLDMIKPDKHPDLCPTCGQRWPQKSDQSSMKALMEDKKKVVADHESEVALHSRALQKAKAELDEAYQKLQTIDDEAPEDIGDLQSYTSSINENFAVLKERHESSQRSIKKVEASKNPFSGMSESSKEKAETYRKKVKELEEELKTNEELVLVYTYWSKAFGKSGIPSYMIDSAIPILNKSAKEISRILTDGELQVTFDPASAKGSGSVFEVKAEFTDGSDSYDMSSRGEHSRSDLAVLLAIRELLAKRGRHSCNQVFIDEVFDGLDQHGVTNIMTLLRQRYKGTSFFVVSHDPEIKSYADEVILVEKKKGISAIAE